MLDFRYSENQLEINDQTANTLDLFDFVFSFCSNIIEHVTQTKTSNRIVVHHPDDPVPCHYRIARKDLLLSSLGAKDNGVHEFSRKKGGAGIRGSCCQAQEATTGGLKRERHRVAPRQGSTAGGPWSEHQCAAPRTKFKLFLRVIKH